MFWLWSDYDLSDELWDKFKIRDVKLKKQMGLYEIKNIDNANICTIAVNPKEYLEKLKNRLINKKHKGVRQDTQGMKFESYTERINVLKEIGSEKNKKKLVQKRQQVKNTERKMTSVNKVQYFSGGIVSLLFGHPTLSSLWDFKKSYPKIHIVIEKEKERLLKLEEQIVAKNERLRVLRSIFSQPISYYKLNGNTRVSHKDKIDFITTFHYTLNSKWL